MAVTQETTMVVFNHIPKCGGTTIYQNLMKLYGYSFSADNLLSRICPEDFLHLSTYDEVFVFGHLASGIEKNFSWVRNTKYFTFLRDPLDRALSNYQYDFNYGLEMSFEGYVLAVLKPNVMVEYIGGGDLDLAKYYLETKYVAFGLVERFAESFAHILKSVGRTLPHFETKNKSLGKKPEVSDRVLALFNERNRLDIELYRFAAELLDKRLKAENSQADQAIPEVVGQDALDIYQPESRTGSFDLNLVGDVHKRFYGGLRDYAEGRKDQGIRALLEIAKSRDSFMGLIRRVAAMALESEDGDLRHEVKEVLRRDIDALKNDRFNSGVIYRLGLLESLVTIMAAEQEWKSFDGLYQNFFSPRMQLYYQEIPLRQVFMKHTLWVDDRILVLSSTYMYILQMLMVRLREVVPSVDVGLVDDTPLRRGFEGFANQFHCLPKTNSGQFIFNDENLERLANLKGVYDALILPHLGNYNACMLSEFIKLGKWLSINRIYLYSPWDNNLNYHRPILLHELPLHSDNWPLKV